MTNIYSITYKTNNNPNISKYQNESRGITTKIVKGEAEAKAFANSVGAITIRNYIGRTVKL